ncbi:MAG TPA: DNA gyrase inhibitor YacG [Pseudomonadales bacterium]|nr:DNA gyrase inhibitor YacG [Pseudomonadales bacterium]
MTTTPLSLHCPTCKREIFWTSDFPERPFCSQRCKLIDLGAWSSEEHTIPGETSVEAIEAIMDAADRGEIDGFN